MGRLLAEAQLDRAEREASGLAGALVIMGRLDLAAAVRRDIVTPIKEARAALSGSDPRG